MTKKAASVGREPGMSLCAGIDVGGTKVSSALFSPEGAIVVRDKVLLEKEGGQRAAEQVVRVIASAMGSAAEKGATVEAVGLCIPGVVFQSTGMVWAPNIPGWDYYPLARMIRERITVPLVMDSDRSAYVLGEQWRGAAKGLKDVVFLAVGTGIGAGILSGGRLCRGAEDIAGAVGWFGLNPHYQKDYAAMGCFEAEASGNSLGRKARQALQSGSPSAMLKLVGDRVESVTAETVAEAARANDPLAVELMDETVSYLAMGLANIVSILNPEMVVLGGGLFQAGQVLFERVKKEFVRWAQPLAARSVQVELTRLGEDAGLYGAGRLAWESLKGEKSCLL
jgi:glucokinase